MKCLTFFLALSVAFCAVLAPVIAEPTPLDPPAFPPAGLPDPPISSIVPSNTFLGFPLPVIDSKMFCSPIQDYLCCGGEPPLSITGKIKNAICKKVIQNGCDDGIKDICPADADAVDTWFSLVLFKVPKALISYVKYVICCTDKEKMAYVQKLFCTTATRVLCCDGVDLLDVNSINEGLCGPCAGYCQNGGTCTEDKGTNIPTCSCEEPFFGERCQFRCCNEQEYQWVEGSNGTKPVNAIAGCYDKQCDVYVARVDIFGDKELMKPGKLIPDDKVCYLGQREGPSTFIPEPFANYEVLSGSQDNMVWVKAEGDGRVAPQCAVDGSTNSSRPIYVGLGLVKNTPGTDSTGFIEYGELTFAYNGTEAYGNTVSDGFDYLTCVVNTI